MACSHQALGSSGGVQEVDFQEMDIAQDVNFSHPSPHRNNPLWHKQGEVGAGQVQGQIQHGRSSAG